MQENINEKKVENKRKIHPLPLLIIILSIGLLIHILSGMIPAIDRQGKAMNELYNMRIFSQKIHEEEALRKKVLGINTDNYFLQSSYNPTRSNDKVTFSKNFDGKSCRIVLSSLLNEPDQIFVNKIELNTEVKNIIVGQYINTPVRKEFQNKLLSKLCTEKENTVQFVVSI